MQNGSEICTALDRICVFLLSEVDLLTEVPRLFRESNASKDLCGEPVKEHAEDDRPSQGSGLEGE